jgi:hypothetical protein
MFHRLQRLNEKIHIPDKGGIIYPITMDHYVRNHPLKGFFLRVGA